MILPAAAWSENDGTFTNSERRVSRVRTASATPGQAMPNWWLFKQIARRFDQQWPADSAREIANWLTHAALDSITMTAEYKACAVRIDKLEGS